MSRKHLNIIGFSVVFFLFIVFFYPVSLVIDLLALQVRSGLLSFISWILGV